MLFTPIRTDGEKFNLEIPSIHRVNPSPKTWQKKDRQSRSELIWAARIWVWVLVLVPAVLTIAAILSPTPQSWLTITLVGGLIVFGAVFAVNSSLHSYLILSFTRAERVTIDVGFYYMANAGGRLLGTVLSGLTFQVGGLALMLGTAALMVTISALATGRLSFGS